MEEDYIVVEQTEYRGAYIEIRRWEGSRCALYRAHWNWDADPKNYCADVASTSHTMALKDAERAIDRKLDGTTDHYSLADLQAQEDAGAAMADSDHDGLS